MVVSLQKCRHPARVLITIISRTQICNKFVVPIYYNHAVLYKRPINKLCFTEVGANQYLIRFFDILIIVTLRLLLL